MSELYRDYVTDVVTYITERALRARQERDRAVGESRMLEDGRLLAFNEVVSILRQTGGPRRPARRTRAGGPRPDRDLV